ncbi:MAG: nitroreductase family protein [Salinivirgaceae bacterium]|nr:nitroreductase family protein [Salinivirgaceae bacterium]
MQALIIAVLSAALIIAVVMLAMNKRQSGSIADVVITNIMTRTSIRSYTAEPITDSQIETLLKAGMAAPSALNKQPWKFVVVRNRAKLKEIADSIGPSRSAASAACVIAVCGDMTKTLDGVGRDFWIHDCSAATENILLAAHALGLGAVWMGISPDTDRVKVVRSVLDIPDNQEVLCLIAIGHPAENPTPKDKWDPENYRVIA